MPRGQGRGGRHSNLDEGLSSECEALLDVSKGAVQHGSEGVHSLPPPPHLLLYYLHADHYEHQAAQLSSVEDLLGLVTFCPIGVCRMTQHVLCSLTMAHGSDIVLFIDTAVTVASTADTVLASWAQFPLTATKVEG